MAGAHGIGRGCVFLGCDLENHGVYIALRMLKQGPRRGPAVLVIPN